MTTKPIEDSWAAVRSRFADDNLDTFFRLRTQMPAKQVRQRYRTMMVIKWPYQAKKDGMPREADLKRMAAFEDALEIAVETPALGIQAACLTGNGRRTWRYYAAAPDHFLAAMSPLLEAHGPEPHMFKQIEDSRWEGFAELMPLLEGACDED